MHTRTTSALFCSRALAGTLPRAVAGLCATVLAGCSTTMTGLDGSSEYACQAPEGVKCQSVSGTYYNALANNLPAQRKPAGGTAAPAAPPPAPTHAAHAALRASRAASALAPPDAAPLRSAPRVLRLWIKPWEDADRDLVGETVVYVQVDNGRWLLEHVQGTQREAFVPVRPAAAAASKVGSAAPAPAALGQIAPAANDTAAFTQALRALQGRAPAPEE